MHHASSKEDDLKNEDDFKNKDDIKNEDDLKNEDNLNTVYCKAHMALNIFPLAPPIRPLSS